MKNVEKEELRMDGFKSGIFPFDSEDAKKGSSHKTQNVIGEDPGVAFLI